VTAEADPRARTGHHSDWIQIQNETPFALNVQIRTDQWAVSPSQSATLPLPPDAGGVALTATNNGAAAGGSITGIVSMIWGLEWQEPPQPDGPLISAIAASAITGIVLPSQGGTGIANNNASTITISGAFPLTLTLSASTSLTLPTSGTVTALGNATQGSGSIVLATAPTLTGLVTINSAGTNTHTLTINDAAGDTTTGGVLNLVCNHLTASAVAFLTSSSSITSGALWDINHSTSTYTGSALFMNMGLLGGVFTSGFFLDLQVNNVITFRVAASGQIIASLSANVPCIDLSGTNTSTALFKANSGGGAGFVIAMGSTNVPTFGHTPGTVAAAQTGWIAFQLSTGVVHYLPYW
jgi:hypothetical protein